MKASKQARREGKRLFQSCLVNGVLDEECARKAVQEVFATRPRDLLKTLEYFRHLVALDIARRTALVESAVPLTAGQQATVTENLTRTYGSGLNIGFSQNPDLIGGMRIRVGSDVYDGSLQARLRAVAESF